MNEKSISGKQLNAWLKNNYENYDELMAEAEAAINLDISIYEMRKAVNMTQKELAKRMNTQQGNISKLEKNLSHARVDTLIKLAAVFGKKMTITFDDFVVE